MKHSGSAIFVKRPRTITDLLDKQSSGNKQPYEIVKNIELNPIDYENFTTDMLADRQFIEDHFLLCKQAEVWYCLWIHQEQHEDGILVLPTGNCYVGWAAYIE